MYKRLFRCGIFFLLASFSSFTVFAQQNFAQYVDPMIGTGGHGHTYPGAVLPHGMVQLSPDTRLDGWDGCGGYHYSDDYIYGFTHTHLSGTGCSDYGDILLMPMTGTPSPDNKIYGSKFSHKNEKASAGYYSVKLDDDNILAELTATERVGFHRYTFASAAGNSIILDLKHRDEVIASSLKLINRKTLVGMRRSKAWADDQYVYFAMEFSTPFSKFGLYMNDEVLPESFGELDSFKNIKAFFTFNAKQVMVKVGISGVSEEGARRNLDAELSGWDFDQTKQQAEKKWNDELGRIEVTGTDKQQLRNFYTALYHTMVVPCINMDVDRQYRGRDSKIHTAEGFTNYSVFSLWDTYRACHPLYTIIDRQRTQDYINSFLAQYKEGGRLPVWELSGCETDCMIGYHSVPVIVDAFAKGINGFDTKLALEAMVKSATWNHLGLPALMDHGFLEKDDEHESVSKTLEYAYDDWCIALFAKMNGNMDVYNNFIRRGQAYKNMFDPSTSFMRPRKNGDWLKPYDPYEVNNNYTEGNSWQYAFYAPQDMKHYIEMLGGRKKLEERLDSIFTTTSKMTGLELSDITGLIGQYAHGNEPSHHIAYLYNFAGKPSKTAEKVRYILTNFYKDQPDGLIGNEDCGQMSAWYVLSAMGFYPVTPGTNDYMIGSPLFPEVKIHLENGKLLTILSVNNSAKNIYLTAASINGKPLNAYFSHGDIENGGVMIFQMTNKPTAFGTKVLPSTSIDDKLIVLNPVIDGGEPSFKKPKTIRIYSNQPNSEYYYTTDGSIPTANSKKYTMPFTIDTSTTIRAIALNKGELSYITTAKLVKAPNNWTITLNNKYEPQYSAGGDDALINGLTGSVNWRKGNWQGYQKKDMDVTIDLTKVKKIHQVKINFLQDTKSWIIMPKQVEIAISKDGKNFTEVYQGTLDLPAEEMTVTVKNLLATFAAVDTRYIRVVAHQFGKMPAWSEGAGGDTHIFCDEISVE